MYRIKDWALHFENAESRKIKGARWLPLPNKHDGKGFRRLTKHDRKVDLFCAWTLILQIASKCPVRGELADENGPLTAQDLADVTDFPLEIFELAFAVLQEPRFGWIEDVPWPGRAARENTPPHPDASGQPPDSSGDAGTASGDPGNEGKGTELKGTEIKTTPLSPPRLAVAPHSDEVTAVLKAYPKKREREGGGFEDVHVGEGDRAKVAEFLNAHPDYPLLAAVKHHGKATRRPKNLAAFLANPTAREVVLAGQEGAKPRASPPSDIPEPFQPNPGLAEVAAAAREQLNGHRKGSHVEAR